MQIFEGSFHISLTVQHSLNFSFNKFFGGPTSWNNYSHLHNNNKSFDALLSEWGAH